MLNKSLGDIYKYCMDHTTDESDIFQKIKDHTNAHEEFPQMLSEKIVGTLLQTLIRISRAQRVLEVGTFTGYSALKMAEALPDNGELFTCELADHLADTAQGFFDSVDFGSKITILRGQAIESIEDIQSESIDLSFIDADKVNYPEYYEIIITKTRKGGIIVLDNMLWSGSVISPSDPSSVALRKTADMIKNDARVNHILLPVRDGLMICTKK
tara:strand:+ start:3255 stop:3893 length:639 start_codon:yes stop_codon:yes gene_type:complete